MRTEQSVPGPKATLRALFGTMSSRASRMFSHPCDSPPLGFVRIFQKRVGVSKHMRRQVWWQLVQRHAVFRVAAEDLRRLVHQRRRRYGRQPEAGVHLVHRQGLCSRYSLRVAVRCLVCWCCRSESSCDSDVGRVGVGLDKSANGLGFRGPANYKLPVCIYYRCTPRPAAFSNVQDRPLLPMH